MARWRRFTVYRISGNSVLYPPMFRILFLSDDDAVAFESHIVPAGFGLFEAAHDWMEADE